jgi:hypothetical protein
MPAKKLTPQQQRDRRAKKMLAVLGVVLLIAMAIELPGLLGGKKSAAPPSTATSTTTTSSTGAAAAPASLASLQVVATPQGGKLVSFGHFSTKDPFHALVDPSGSASGSSSSGSGGGGTTTGSTAPPATAPASTTTTPSVTFAVAPTTTTAAPTGPMVLGVVMRLNGKRKVIAPGVPFPAANPVFKLVAVGRKAMWISLVGGTFGNGQQTLKIERGHPVKLVDTTANLDFVIQLVKMAMVPKPAPVVAVTTTTSSTTTGGATTTAASTIGG